MLAKSAEKSSTCWYIECLGDACAGPPLRLAGKVRPLPPLQLHLKGFSIVVMIRLARMGARKQPYYRIVVIEKRSARNGRSLEVVGTYNPRTNPASVELKRDRIDYWTGKGAQMSDRVAKLVQQNPAPAAA